MTRAELAELLAKPSDALTSRDVERLEHAAHMIELFNDDPVMLERALFSEQEARPVYQEYTVEGNPVLQRVLVGYEKT